MIQWGVTATLDVSPDCAAAAAKPRSAQIKSTPSEPAAVTEDRERKPVLPRIKLVRDPASFGYWQLLPFLNQMASKGSDISIGKEIPSENKVSIPNKELSRSDSGLADERAPVEGSQCGAAPVDSVEPLVVKARGDVEIQDSVKEETKVVPGDLASSMPVTSLARCARSRLVHHASSFSYKRMLPFLMENETSSLEADRAKCRRLSEEKQMASVENDVQASGQIQSATVDVSPNGSVAEVQKATQEEELASAGDPLSSEKGELTSNMNTIPAGGHSQAPEERNAAEVEITVEEKASKSVLSPVKRKKSISPARLHPVLAPKDLSFAANPPPLLPPEPSLVLHIQSRPDSSRVRGARERSRHHQRFSIGGGHQQSKGYGDGNQ